MEQLAAEGTSLTGSGQPIRYAWLDIEDDAALVGDLDVETFPTLLIADAAGVRFFGPVTPAMQTLSRLLRSVSGYDSSSREHGAATAGLVAALLSMPRLWLNEG